MVNSTNLKIGCLRAGRIKELANFDVNIIRHRSIHYFRLHILVLDARYSRKLLNRKTNTN